MSETKSEIRARINELETIAVPLSRLLGDNTAVNALITTIDARITKLKKDESEAQEDLFLSVMKSHEVICAVKQMDEKAAYGQDPYLYYGAGIAAEAGELLNKIIKTIRKLPAITPDEYHDEMKRAVISELPDVIVYSAVLAQVSDVDITKEVNDKVKVVIQRALSGHYGPPLLKKE